MLNLVLVTALSAALDAPVSDVTVFSDRARVVRTVQVTAAASTTVEFPPLPMSIDLGSVRLEASGAEVKRVDLKRLEDDALPTDEARALLKDLEALDDQLAAARGEENQAAVQLQTLNRLNPTTPIPEPQKATPKLSAGGWSAVMTFIGDQQAKVQAKQRELEAKIYELNKKRGVLSEKAALLGGAQRRQGWKVTAEISGAGPAKLSLNYFVTRARWLPLYDLQLNSDTGKVNVAFSGLVSQESGEDWGDAALTLSTAIPATATKFPKLLTWKIGEKERFIPTPSTVSEGIKPPPPALERPTKFDEVTQLRALLAQAAGGRFAGRGAALEDTRSAEGGETVDFDREDMNDEISLGYVDKMEESAKRRPPPMEPNKPRPPPPPPMVQGPRGGVMAERKKESYAPERSYNSAPGAPMSAAMEYDEPAPEPAPTFGFSLAPPSAYRAPQFSPELPAAAAGGFDLSWTSLQRESVQSGKGARRVALFTEAWPVSVERKLFPALFPEAFLVAELKNPSSQPLPAGTANLFVGADPAGTARLKLVSPGEAFTLPLGIDRAIRPVRNVKVTQSEKGVISKDEITDYLVTLEVANPYRAPIAVRLLDQIPVTTQKEVTISFLEAKPGPIQDKATGALEWRLSLPASQKTVITYRYTIKRPKGWLMQQQEVSR